MRIKKVFSMVGVRPLFIVLLFFIVFRVLFFIAVFARPEISLFPDSGGYQYVADNILSGKAYSFNGDDQSGLIRTIGYPMFIAAVRLLGGGDEVWKVAFAQLVLSGALALLVFFYLYRSVGRSIAFLSSLFFIMDPLSIIFSLTILSETLFTFVLFLAFIFIARWAETKYRFYLIMAGVFLGAACLVRPIGQLFIVIWLGMILLYPDGAGQLFGKKTILAKINNSLAFLIPILLLLTPWIVRNSLLWDCPTISSISKINNRDLLAAKVLSESENIPLSDVVAKLTQSDPGLCPKKNIMYFQILLSHPKEFINLSFGGLTAVWVGNKADLWFQVFGVDYYQPDLWNPYINGGFKEVFSILRGEFIKSPAYFLGFGALAAFQFFIYGLTLSGVFSIRLFDPVGKKWEVILMAVTLFVLMITPGMIGDERFRVPAQPYFICIAGYGMNMMIQPFLQHWVLGLKKKKLLARE